MATIDIYDLTGSKVGTLELADEVFGAVNEDLLWEAVKHYRAAQRAGTHATKNRKLVSGSGKKLWRQKGTGRARVGSIRSPLWRHGGTIHGRSLGRMTISSRARSCWVPCARRLLRSSPMAS